MRFLLLLLPWLLAGQSYDVVLRGGRVMDYGISEGVEKGDARRASGLAWFSDLCPKHGPYSPSDGCPFAKMSSSRQPLIDRLREV